MDRQIFKKKKNRAGWSPPIFQGTSFPGRRNAGDSPRTCMPSAPCWKFEFRSCAAGTPRPPHLLIGQRMVGSEGTEDRKPVPVARGSVWCVVVAMVAKDGGSVGGGESVGGCVKRCGRARRLPSSL